MNQPKLNTIFLGIIALSTAVIAIQQSRPTYTGETSGTAVVNSKSGEVMIWDANERKLQRLETDAEEDIRLEKEGVRRVRD
jgi:hypothetical protein